MLIPAVHENRVHVACNGGMCTVVVCTKGQLGTRGAHEIPLHVVKQPH
jgi:hypothetical protein